MGRGTFPVLVALMVEAFDPQHADDIAAVELKALERETVLPILDGHEVFEHTTDVVALGNRNYYRNRTVRDVRDEDALRGLRGAYIMAASEPYSRNGQANLSEAIRRYYESVTGVSITSATAGVL
jgi:hypothetical protein